jgi:hypothetical protein
LHRAEGQVPSVKELYARGEGCGDRPTRRSGDVVIQSRRYVGRTESTKADAANHSLSKAQPARWMAGWGERECMRLPPCRTGPACGKKSALGHSRAMAMAVGASSLHHQAAPRVSMSGHRRDTACGSQRNTMCEHQRDTVGNNAGRGAHRNTTGLEHTATLPAQRLAQFCDTGSAMPRRVVDERSRSRSRSRGRNNQACLGELREEYELFMQADAAVGERTTNILATSRARDGGRWRTGWKCRARRARSSAVGSSRWRTGWKCRARRARSSAVGGGWAGGRP